MKKLKLFKVATLAAISALLLTMLPATGAMAADNPTNEQLITACDWADHCEFIPQAIERYTTNQSVVSPMTPNCGPGTVDLQSNWSETKGTTDSVGGSITASASIFKIFEVSVTATYNHEWSRSSSRGGFLMIHVPPMHIGYVTKSAAMERVYGYYKMNFGHREWGHYYWWTGTVAVEGPDKDGIGKEIVQGHTRPMTDSERRLHCPHVAYLPTRPIT